jgi:lipopolysaccharide export system permease protein
MSLIDRYLWRQLRGPTLVAAASLSIVAILSQSLSSLGVLIDQRQSVLVFAKIILLAMPQLIVLILPVAVLIAALIVMNRLHTEQEIVICFAGGMSRWAVIAPAIRLASILTVGSLVITLWIQPWSYRALRDTLEAARADLASSMIKPGAFTHPAPGVTVYAQSIDDRGTIHNLFIDRRGGKGQDSTITAHEGRLQKRGGAPILVLRHGANQEFSPDGVLNFLSFDEYIFDLRQIMSLQKSVHYKLSDRYLHELFFPDLDDDWARLNIRKLHAEGHARLSTPLYNIAFMAMAMAAVLGGAFSRLGYGARIGAVAAAALVTRTLGFAAQAAAGGQPFLNVLQYGVPIGAAVAASMILYGGVGRRRAQTPATAPGWAH